MQHVVMFSGGIGSWAAGKRVAERHGTDKLVHLFTDTLIEDADLYRFLGEAAANVGGQLVRIAEGRSPWQVFRDEKMIGNTRADLCSRILKRDLADKWLAEHCDPADTAIYVGIDWSEIHRFDNGEGGGAKHRYARLGWRCEAPLCEPPYLNKRGLLEGARREGPKTSRGYALGAPHDNCGWRCIKAGQGHFTWLLRVAPERYAEWETEEADPIFDGHTILRDRSDGDTKPLSLRQLRERIEAGWQPDLFDIGGCGCFVDEAV